MKPWFLAFLILGSWSAGAQEVPAPSAPESSPLLGLLGLTPAQVYGRLGPPEEVFPLKAGDISYQVVHYHPSHVYVFYFQNRVWQVRLDQRYAPPFEGVRMGQARDQVLKALGKPQKDTPELAVYDLGFQTYPRKLRLVFTAGVLSDAYYYRGDF